MENKGFKKAGIVHWIAGNGHFKPWERARIITDNETSVGNAKRLGLPIDIDFGSFDTIEEMSAAVPEECKREMLFIIRCPHRTNPNMPVQRKLFVPWDEVAGFVAELPGGYEQYRLGLREASEAEWSGTIICSKGGDHITIEIWKGQHRVMDDGNMDSSFRGIFRDEPGFPRRFVWSDGCTTKIKEMALGALRFFAHDLRPKEEFFTEFCIKGDRYRFLGVSHDPFWTERNQPPQPSVDELYEQMRS